MSESRLQRVFEKLDAIHAEDPELEQVGGRSVPAELAYADRMTAWLERLEPAASELLRIAVRAQHLRRFELPRSEYPEGRAGYLSWRTELAKRHAERTASILREEGYADGEIDRVVAMVRKRGLKTDPDVQALEDVACLVFLEHEYGAFIEAHDDAKVIDILQKTWGKMSERAREAALALNVEGRPKALLARALGREET